MDSGAGLLIDLMKGQVSENGNLFSNIPADLPEEMIEILGEGKGSFRIERIVSRGHASSPGFWYEQETAEWVVLLKGRAVLKLEEEDQSRELGPGDWLEIPAGCRHRVEETDADEDTVWLAVHWQ